MGSILKPKQVGPTQEDVMAATKPIDLFTPLGQATFGEGGAGTVELSPVMQQWVDTLMGRAEAQEEALGSYDPGQSAEEYYTKFVEPGLRKMQERDFLGAEARTLAQGRTGTTGGSRFLSDLLAAQEDIRLGARGQAFQQAQQFKDLQRGRQLDDITLAQQMMAAPTGLLGTGITAGQGRGQILSQYRPQFQESTGMKLLKIGAGIAGAMATGGTGLFASAAGAGATAAGGLGGGLLASAPRVAAPILGGGLGTGISSYGGTLAAGLPIGWRG